MDAILQQHFQRVEGALNTLIDSISTYSPSPSAALALIEADDELSKGLEQLAVHQSNHATIGRLRQTSSALSDQISQTLTVLANTRAELPSTLTAASHPDNDRNRDVPYKEVLAYAKKISKFTVPPTFRVAPPPPQEQSSPKQKDEEQRGENNGVVEPSSATTDKEVDDGKGAGEGIAIASLPAEESQRMNLTATFSFVPWPTEDTIRRGALARIQGMVEAGLDPATSTGLEVVQQQQQEQGGEDRGVEEEQRGTEVRDQRSMPIIPKSSQANDTAGAKARMDVKEEKPTVFGGLDLYDPDEE